MARPRRTAVKKTTAPKTAAPKAVAAPAEETVKAAEVKEEVKAVKEEKAVEAKAETAAEEAPAKKAAAKKAPAKKALKTNLFVQAAGKEVSMDEAVARVKKAWKATGHKIGDLKEITVYVKPEEGSIYYVVNGDVTGRVDF